MKRQVKLVAIVEENKLPVILDRQYNYESKDWLAKWNQAWNGTPG
jgi:hypothetical protein